MRIRCLTKRAVTVTALINLPLNWLFAQTAPQTEDEPIDVEPPLLVKPWEPDRASDETDEDAPESELDAGKLAQRLEAAKKDAEAANRLVKKGVLAKVEAEQRALRVLRLQSELGEGTNARRRRAGGSGKIAVGCETGDAGGSGPGGQSVRSSGGCREDSGRQLSQGAARERVAKCKPPTKTVFSRQRS